jgi:nicotinate-nucleotide adenylyltransferase
LDEGRELRLGILGGTFDPIHLGHLRVAEEIGEELELEKIYLLPAAVPPHKETKPITPFHHRLAMTQLAAKESPMLEVLDLEGRRQGLSYSIETLRECHQIFKPSPILFFILGMDAFLEIKTWKEYERLFDYANFVVINRPRSQPEELEPFLLSLNAGFDRSEKAHTFIHSSGNVLIYKEATLMDISSTQIRGLVASGKTIRFLIPESVRAYLIEKRLYRTDESPR